MKVFQNIEKHSFFTHFPKDRNCGICLRTKITRASCRRGTGTVVPRAEKFGDLMDRIIFNVEQKLFRKHKRAYNVLLGADKEAKSHLH